MDTRIIVRHVKRKAKRGEYIIIVNARLTHGEYVNGCILRVCKRKKHSVFVDGVSVEIYDDEYRVWEIDGSRYATVCANPGAEMWTKAVKCLDCKYAEALKNGPMNEKGERILGPDWFLCRRGRGHDMQGYSMTPENGYCSSFEEP